jgi:O-antigen/teichoic acid export membrane protein
VADEASDDVPVRASAASTGSLARGGAVWLLATLVGGAALVVLDAWTGRVLGAHAYGAYGALRRVAQFAGFVVLLGLENVVVRHVAVAASAAEARRVLRVAVVTVGVAGATFGGVLALASGVLAQVFQLGPDGPEAVRWIAVSLPLAALRMVAVAAAQGRGHVRARPFVMSILWPATLSLGVFAVAASWMPGSPLVAMIRAWVAAIGVGCAWSFAGLLVWRRAAPFAESRGSTSDAPAVTLSGLASMAVPLWLHGMVTAAYAWADHLVLAAVHGPREAALYGPVVALTPVYGLALTALNGPLAPMLAARHAAGDRAGLHLLFRTAARWAFLLSALPVVVSLVVPEGLLLAWPDLADARARSALQVAAAAQWVGVACGSVNYVLVMTGHAGAVWWGAGPALMVSLVGSWVLVPSLGALGASLANGAALVVANVIGARVVAARLGVSVLDAAFVRACAAMALPVAAGAVAARFDGSGWGRLALVAGVVFVAWLPSVWWGGLDAEEREAVRRRVRGGA